MDLFPYNNNPSNHGYVFTMDTIFAIFGEIWIYITMLCAIHNIYYYNTYYSFYTENNLSLNGMINILRNPFNIKN